MSADDTSGRHPMRDVLPIHPSPEPSAARRLIEALGLEPRATAEIRDMYSQPIEASAAASGRDHDLAA
jgi:hypothetical protein